MYTVIDGVKYPLPAPHCDARVLHARGACRFCDDPKNDRWRKDREKAKILYTGELPRDGWTMCPAQAERGMDKINAWPGNEPADAIYDRERAKDLEALRESLKEARSREKK